MVPFFSGREPTGHPDRKAATYAAGHNGYDGAGSKLQNAATLRCSPPVRGKISSADDRLVDTVRVFRCILE